VLPLPEVTWLALLEHQERQSTERARLAEVWHEHGLVFPSERGTPLEPTNLSRPSPGSEKRPACPVSGYTTSDTP
jgi:hypothetical protein